MNEKKATTEGLKRLDLDRELRRRVLPYCRLNCGSVWEDPICGHKVGVLDACNPKNIKRIFGKQKAKLVINDPPYNVVAGKASTTNLFKTLISKYINFSIQWVANSLSIMHKNSHLYVWLGADYKDNFQPLPDFMIMMREFKDFTPRNFITMRNQRGYGTQHNWMWVRQELLHYTFGKPDFKVVYTDIPKILKGYYKVVNGRTTENIERSKSDTIRPGNVWVDIQQVFYRLEE
ncbi:MAG: site-specific DNA-methyltransferase, partial [Deltaproteobacteria bacterium]